MNKIDHMQPFSQLAFPTSIPDQHSQSALPANTGNPHDDVSPGKSESRSGSGGSCIVRFGEELGEAEQAYC